MYYLISNEYVGPNTSSLENDYENIVYGHYIDIDPVPGVKNMSKEPSTDGWLGTTNDWAKYAHGEYQTIEDARAARDALFTETFSREEENEDSMIIGETEDYEMIRTVERVYVGSGETVYDAAEWIGEDARNRMSAATKENAVRALAKEYADVAEDEGVILFGDIFDALSEIRDEMIAEASEE